MLSCPPLSDTQRSIIGISSSLRPTFGRRSRLRSAGHSSTTLLLRHIRNVTLVFSFTSQSIIVRRLVRRLFVRSSPRFLSLCLRKELFVARPRVVGCFQSSLHQLAVHLQSSFSHRLARRFQERLFRSFKLFSNFIYLVLLLFLYHFNFN